MKKELRIYVLGAEHKIYATSTNEKEIERFIETAENIGQVYSLSKFQEAFNNGEINSDTDFILIKEVEIFE